MSTVLDLAGLSLVNAAEAVHKREVSSVALLEACLSELDAHEAQVNATIWMDQDGAYASAQAADAALAAGAIRGRNGRYRA